MGIMYFLSFIGLCAIVLVWYAARSIKHKRSTLKGDPKAPRYVHRAGRHPLLHTHHALPLHATEGGDIWKRRRQHATGEEPGKYAVTARKIQFDDEPAEAPEVPVASMTAIEYTPTDFHKRPNLKR
jgi:hypothetical protein